MHILSQNKDKIVNMNQMAMLDILEESGEIYATQDLELNKIRWVPLGRYDNPETILSNILSALSKDCKIFIMPEA